MGWLGFFLATATYSISKLLTIMYIREKRELNIYRHSHVCRLFSLEYDSSHLGSQ